LAHVLARLSGPKRSIPVRRRQTSRGPARRPGRSRDTAAPRRRPL